MSRYVDGNPSTKDLCVYSAAALGITGLEWIDAADALVGLQGGLSSWSPLTSNEDCLRQENELGISVVFEVDTLSAYHGYWRADVHCPRVEDRPHLRRLVVTTIAAMIGSLEAGEVTQVFEGRVTHQDMRANKVITLVETTNHRGVTVPRGTKAVVEKSGKRGLRLYVEGPSHCPMGFYIDDVPLKDVQVVIEYPHALGKYICIHCADKGKTHFRTVKLRPTSCPT